MMQIFNDKHLENVLPKLGSVLNIYFTLLFVLCFCAKYYARVNRTVQNNVFRYVFLRYAHLSKLRALVYSVGHRKD